MVPNKYADLIKSYNEQDYDKMVDHVCSNGFESYGSGSFRDVYRRGNVVIKIPLCRDGLIDNIIEAKAYALYKHSKTSSGIYLAPCRLLPNGMLMMVAVSGKNNQGVGRFVIDKYEYPKWIQKIDGRQVGFYKGNLVAYDYALNIDERQLWEDELGIFYSYYQCEWLPEYQYKNDSGQF